MSKVVNYYSVNFDIHSVYVGSRAQCLKVFRAIQLVLKYLHLEGQHAITISFVP